MGEAKEREQLLTSIEEFNKLVEPLDASTEEEIDLFFRERFRVENGGSIYIKTECGDKVILVNGELSFFGKSFLFAFDGGDGIGSEIRFQEIDKRIYRVFLGHIVREKFKKHFPI